MPDNRLDMKAQKFVMLAVLAVTLVASPFARAEGTSLDSTTLNLVRTNCATAQVSIKRVQEVDKPTRINRGYLYDSLLKLMVNFNSRVAQSRIDSPELLTITSDFEKQFKTFTSTYTKYDEGLSSLASMNCAANPQKFYDDLAAARGLRDSLNKSVNALDGLVDKYQESIDSVKQIVEAGV